PFLDGDQSWAAASKLGSRIFLSHAPCLSSLREAKSDDFGIDLFQSGHVEPPYIQAALDGRSISLVHLHPMDSARRINPSHSSRYRRKRSTTVSTEKPSSKA